MFSEISRYYDLEDVYVVDAKGRLLQSKSLRLLPYVTGDYMHTVSENDRLDNLAFDYYGQSRNWWRICDGNPSFLSPPSMLGKSPIVTTQFPVTYTSSPDGQSLQPPWADLIGSLLALLGVKDVLYGQDVEVVDDGEEDIYPYLKVTYNNLDVTVEDIVSAIEAEDPGFQVGEPVTIGQVGKSILIPPGESE